MFRVITGFFSGSSGGFKAYLSEIQRPRLASTPSVDEARKDYIAFQRSKLGPIGFF